MTLDRTFWICVTLCLGSVQSFGKHSGQQLSADPVVQHEPFIVVWNIPTARCRERFGIPLPLGDYGIMENQGNAFQGQNMTIFYKNKFGFYPYISSEHRWHNGGLPQKVFLKKHLKKISEEITELLHHSFQGLAVVDWEEWRPLWRRNWGFMKVYQEASKQWVRERFSELPVKKQAYLAEVEFERAAQALMERTLMVGKELRPQGLWGFYSFPDCFNSNWEKVENYTGQCHPIEVLWNNRLMWLWKASTALYPSIYLPPKLPWYNRQHYVHYRLREAFRVAQFSQELPLPVIAYSRVSYRRSSRYLTEADLVHTLGESAALGAAGVVLWGNNSYSHSADSCRNLRKYITTTLGPYVVNVTMAAHMCSHQLCHGNGRCVRRQPGELRAFLHLAPQQWEGEPMLTNFLDMDGPAWELFQCHCYPRWMGARCNKQQWVEPIQNPDCPMVTQHQDTCLAAHDCSSAMGLGLCPHPDYEEKTELR